MMQIKQVSVMAASMWIRLSQKKNGPEFQGRSCERLNHPVG